MDRLIDVQSASLDAEVELDDTTGTDVEERIIQAAASLKSVISDFDGDAFSKRLYSTLGISIGEGGATQDDLSGDNTPE